MKIIPSIDIYNNECVRLFHGKLESRTFYDISPIDYAKKCVEHGFTKIHIVDLNRIFFNSDTNAKLIKSISEIPEIEVECGGGIKSKHYASYLIEDIGVKEVCIGTAAYTDKSAFIDIINACEKENIIVCADFKDRTVYIKGWKETTGIDIINYIESSYNLGIRKFLCTDISKDGALTGYNIEIYKEIKHRFPDIYLICSGGCSSIDDIIALNNAGMDACVIGKVLFENMLDFNQIRAVDDVLNKVDFDKCNGLVPCIVQDYTSKDVLMLAYMNKESLELSIKTWKATFWSRSRQEIWVKGKSHGKYLPIVSMKLDCDNDTILMYVDAKDFGPVCHTGADTCWGKADFSLEYLDRFLGNVKSGIQSGNYTKKMFNGDLNRIAQKVGEEATETVIEAIKGDKNGLIYESADLLFHLIMLLKASDLSLSDIVNELKKRHSC